MVKEEIKKFIAEGRKHKLQDTEIKKRLKKSGFKIHHVEEAFWEIDEAAEHKEQTEQTKKPKIITGTDTGDSGIGFFQKIGLAITKPLTLFEKTKNEHLYPTLLHYMLMMILPYISLIIIGAYLSVEVIMNFTSVLLGNTAELAEISLLGIGGTGAAILISMIFLILLFVIGPTLILGIAGLQHAVTKLYKGKGTYDTAVHTIIYSMTLLIYLFWLPIIPYIGRYLLLATLLWTTILMIGGVHKTAEVSKTKATLIIISTLIILTGILLGALYYFAYKPIYS